MDDIKKVNINIPIPKIKRRERKTKKATGGNPLPVVSTIKFGGDKKPEVMTLNPKPNQDINPTITKQPINIHLNPKPTLLQTPSIKKITPTNIKIIHNKKLIRKTIGLNPTIQIKPNKRRNFTLKRKFSPKNITIHFENTNDIKNKRENIIKDINNMDEKTINAKLIERGLLRPTANPPLEWKKNILIDVLMLPTRL
jgi:hypothetical protein